MKPTKEQFAAFQNAFDYFNKVLFAGELPQVLLTLSRSGKKIAGQFKTNAWASSADDINDDAYKMPVQHEISLNPETFNYGETEIYSTLVHEMVHLWQEVNGTAPRKCYHDKGFAEKMELVGLTPSSTGMPGGKRTGQKMGDYPTPNGVFLQALEKMPKNYLFPFFTYGAIGADKEEGEGEDKGEKKKNKIKYTCPGCDANAWGKPELKLICGECEERFVAQD